MRVCDGVKIDIYMYIEQNMNHKSSVSKNFLHAIVIFLSVCSSVEAFNNEFSSLSSNPKT